MGAIIMDGAPWIVDVCAFACVFLLLLAIDLLAVALCRSAADGDRQIAAADRDRSSAPLEPLNLSRARRRQVAARRRSRVS